MWVRPGMATSIGLPHKGVDDVQHKRAQAAGVVAQVHPQQRGHLVVARAAGAKPATDIGAGTLDQASLERRVHVLVVLERSERPRLHIGQELPEPHLHRIQGGVIQQASAMQGARVCAGPRDVVGR